MGSQDKAVASYKLDLLVRVMKLSYNNFWQANIEMGEQLVEGDEKAAINTQADMVRHFQEFCAYTGYR